MDNGAVGELMSLNRYAYAGANPVNFVDPSGMIYESPGWYSAPCQTDLNKSCQEICAPHLSGGPTGAPSYGELPEAYRNCIVNCARERSNDGDGLLVTILSAFSGSDGSNLLRFPVQADYPDGCTDRTPQECMLYHIDFFTNTPTVNTLHANRNLHGSVGTAVAGFYAPFTLSDFSPVSWLYLIDLAAFAIFVGPDQILEWYNPEGTPLDVKEFYKVKFGQGCMPMYGKQWGLDFVGNLLFGYVGAHVGYPESVLAGGAGIAQILSDLTDMQILKSSDNVLQDFGDAPSDQITLRMGVALYDRCGTNCTSSDVESILAQYREEYVAAEAISPTSACQPKE